MTEQAKDGYELEIELKCVVSYKQYKKLVEFISNYDSISDINGRKLSICDFKQKVRKYRDFDTADLKLLQRGSSLTARDRISTYAITAKFPTEKANVRHEYNESVSAKLGDFYTLDFLSFDLEPIKKAKEFVSSELKEVLRRTVTTNRANLYFAGKPFAELAIDEVTVETLQSGKHKIFYELEIEKKSKEYDIALIQRALQRLFGRLRKAKYASKYKRAMELANPKPLTS